MDASLMPRMKELEQENSRLEKMYECAQLRVEVVGSACKKVVRPSLRVEMAQKTVNEKRLNVR